MKAALLITFVLVGVSHQLNFQKILNDFEDTIDKEANDCYGKFNLDRSALNVKLELTELPNDRNLKCFLQCVMSHLDLFDANGDIAEDKAKKYLDVSPDLEKKVFENCKDVQGADGCEKFYQMTVCIRKYLK